MAIRSHALLGCAALLFLARSASAQSEAARAEALSRYQNGVSLHEKGREEEAYLQFAQAYAVVQTPPILFNLARTEQLTGRPLAAAEHFRAYLALPEHPRITAELRARAQESLEVVSKQLGHLKLDVPLDAIVTVDGKRAEPGVTLEVVPGLRKIVGRRGDETVSLDLLAPAGIVTTAHLTFLPPAVVAPVPSPVVEPMPPPPIPLPPKREPDRTRIIVGWTTAGVAVVALGVGVGFAAAGSSDASTFNTYQSSHPGGCATPSSAVCGEAHNDSSAASRATTVSTVGFVVGGVAALSSAAVWLLWPRETPSKAGNIWIAPAIGDGSYAVQAGGRF